ncbi:MAG TPA: DUF3467 domain-containing protein [Mycobacteriales bacterium]|jgi:hypothetical protein|nr:DUF3467 domain-containing protein [Mycobacteriales bacterium]
MTEPQPQIAIHVPEDLQAGEYANMALVWHTPFDFTLDFAVLQPTTTGPDGQQVVPARVVARVKFPPSQIFQLLQAINANMTNYEAAYGPIAAPTNVEPPEAPGEEI